MSDKRGPGNPYRNPAMLLELGQRALQELMTVDDWSEILERMGE